MFIAAGLYTITRYLDEFFGERSSIALSKFCPNGLISYGINLEGKSKRRKFKPLDYAKKMDELFETTIKKHRKETFWVLDSGGYQLAIGLLANHHIPDYIDSYIYFLENYTDNFDEAFTLDMPVTKNLFKKEEEVYQFNKESYLRTSVLPDRVRDKLLFVSHFRTLHNFDVWNKLIYEDDLAKYYKRFSIGGLVTGQNVIHKLPVNLYTIGLLQIILYWKDKQNIPDPFRFHILGASNHKSVLFFYLLEEAIKDIYGINLALSYDSSSLFKKMLRARNFTYFDPNTTLSLEVSAKSKNLNKIVHQFKRTSFDIIKQEIESMARELGIDLEVKEIYDEHTGTFSDSIQGYIILLEAYEQHKFDEWARQEAKRLYQLYKTNLSKYESELSQCLINLNKGGKASKSVRALSKKYTNSLDMIPKLDSIDALTSFMHTYNDVTDVEPVEGAPVWDLV